jgi:putative transposase
MALVTEHRATLGVAPTCQALAVPRASYYRWQHPPVQEASPVRSRRLPRALPPEERQHVLALLHDERFADLPPAEVYATLLDEGKYVCSIRTMYRVLQENAQVHERRRQLRHPRYAAPELLATGPNQLWSWDITKLKGPAKWTYFYLYVILDVFSRYVVGWMAALQESATLAQRLIEETCARQGVARDTLTLHADRGPAMLAKSVALLLADLGVTQTHSRPHVSNDNPYSESQFKTLKYHPEFPDRFGSLQDARSFLLDFFQWYNTQHHHGGLGLLTPWDVHHGRAATRLAEREATLRAAFAATPERFVRGVPTPPALPQAVWINKPRAADAGAPSTVPLPGKPSSADPVARRARGAPEGVAQRARRAGDSGPEPLVAVAQQAKELHTKF